LHRAPACVATFPFNQKKKNNLPTVVSRLFDGQHVDTAHRMCICCGGHAVADKLHMVRECAALQPPRQWYAVLMFTDTDTMRSFFAHKDHMQVFKIVLDSVNFVNI